MTSGRDKAIFLRTIKSARLGLPDAQYEVGLMYANGIGVAQDFKQAIHWIRLSAERGHVPAQYLLATRYASGVAIEKNEHQAFVWFLRAAAQEHPKAYFRLGKLHGAAHPEAAFACFMKAAELGTPEAQLAVAQAFTKGDGVDPDVLQAFHWCKAAAEQGLAASQHALAEMYAAGQGVSPDLDAAFFWYRRAASQRYAPAQVAMELLDSEGVGRISGQSRRRRAAAERRQIGVDEWVNAAEHGDANVWYHLGLMFELGMAVPEDLIQAEYWYSRSAHGDDVRAQLALAKLLEVRQAPGAGNWLLKAAERGAVDAQVALGQRLLGADNAGHDLFRGMAWCLKAGEQRDHRAWRALADIFRNCTQELATIGYRKAAELGDAQAQYVVAQQYATGVGVFKDPSVAVSWYKLSAEQGHAEAQSALGACYLAGVGVASDFPQALEWLQKAAEQGDAKAQWNIGSIFASGRGGIKRDLPAAFVWCNKSAAAGFVPAQATLGVLFTRTRDFEQAAVWLRKAAQLGDAEAQYNLGVAYIKGQGVSADLGEAFRWIVLAAEQGLAPAQARLGLMYVTGDGVALDPIEAHKWLILASKAGDSGAIANYSRSEAQLGLMQIAEAQRRADIWMDVSARKQTGNDK
ncbi:tetratricopeptide repeat protein [Rhodoferax saidenbachensis]|uniref:TPR repeat protein n=1 Tax=Rhodoferax saidenbachensis TaxID=1484693 RepID=A0ABU1ZSR2_9BURK|nr:tetratricopeptide repeat protein [Rhodoferax saidenbachensis]MDR7308528.1 TPR repeat protein [Rhodoferax saidenbachensis]